MMRLSTLFSYLVQQVLDDFNLGRYLGTAHDSGERTVDVVQHLVNSLDFLFHQIAEHLVVLVEVFGDEGCGSVGAVSCAEGVVHVAVCIRSQLLGELLLALLDGFLGSSLFLVRSVFGQTTGFTFFFGIETEVFQ